MRNVRTMKAIKLISTILILILMMSMCSIRRAPRFIKDAFTFCFTGKSTGIDSLLNIEGYFEQMSLIRRSPTVGGFRANPEIYYLDTIFSRFMFFDNGLFATIPLPRGERDMSSFLKNIAKNSETERARFFYETGWGSWGSYVIRGDTIKVQSVGRARSLNDGWTLRETWFKIIDRNTIIAINAMNPAIDFPQPSNPQAEFPAVFVPIPVKPTPKHSWILRKRWFWCSEQEWRDFMERGK